MNQIGVFSPPIILILTYLVTYLIMMQIDKAIKFSSFIKEKLNIDKRSKVLLFTAILLLFFYVVPFIVFRIESSIRLLIAGLILGVVTSLSNRLQNLIVRNKAL